MRHKRFMASMFAALLTAACEGPTIDERNAPQLMDDFAAGRIKLLRNNPIAASNVGSTKRAYGFWFNHQWNMLAKEIIENGYDDDINWFYMGEAANGGGRRGCAHLLQEGNFRCQSARPQQTVHKFGNVGMLRIFFPSRCGKTAWPNRIIDSAPDKCCGRALTP